jgi:uncharacterized membrane protein YtjA (UPF0391 family)
MGRDRARCERRRICHRDAEIAEINCEPVKYQFQGMRGFSMGNERGGTSLPGLFRRFWSYFWRIRYSFPTFGQKTPGKQCAGWTKFLHENITLNHGGYMLRWAAIFFVIAIIAALLGFTGVAGAAANIAVFLFYLFVAVFVVLLLLGLFAGRRL